jgi:hypothetical protein
MKEQVEQYITQISLKHIILDLSSINFIDSMGINAMIQVNNSGATYIANGFPADLPLDTFKNLPGWVSSTTAADSDQVSRFTGASWQSFYYNSANNRWQLASNNNNASTVKIAAGTPVLINRIGGASGAQFLDQAVPYSLE